MSEAWDPQRCRQALEHARSDPRIHQAVLDSPPLTPEQIERLRALIPPLGTHRARDAGERAMPRSPDSDDRAADHDPANRLGSTPRTSPEGGHQLLKEVVLSVSLAADVRVTRCLETRRRWLL